MKYLCDAWVWMCFGMGVIYPIAVVAMHQHLGLDRQADKRWTTKRIIFVCIALAALFSAGYVVHGYLLLERYEISFSIGMFLGGIIAAGQGLSTRFGLQNSFQPVAWKSAFTRALAAEGKSIDDLKKQLARTTVQMVFAMVAVLLLLLIVHKYRLFGG